MTPPRKGKARKAGCGAVAQAHPTLQGPEDEAMKTEIETALSRFTRPEGEPEYVCARHDTASCPSCLAYVMGDLRAALASPPDARDCCSAAIAAERERIAEAAKDCITKCSCAVGSKRHRTHCPERRRKGAP